MTQKTYPIKNIGVDELQKLAEFALEVSNALPKLYALISIFDSGIGKKQIANTDNNEIKALLIKFCIILDPICGDDQQIDMKKIAIKLARDAYGCTSGRDWFQQEWEDAYFADPEPLPLPTLKIGDEEIHFEDK